MIRRFVVDIESCVDGDVDTDAFGNNSVGEISYLSHIIEIDPDVDIEEAVDVIYDEHMTSGSVCNTIGNSFESAVAHYMFETK